MQATAKIAKAGLVPSDANLLPAYGSFGGLEQACREFCERVNPHPLPAEVRQSVSPFGASAWLARPGPGNAIADGDDWAVAWRARSAQRGQSLLASMAASAEPERAFCRR